MAWIYLFIAGLLEIGWAIGLKYTDGFSRPLPSIATACAMVGSFTLLSMALKTIPVGTAYAVWTGIGAAGAFALGIFVLGEAATPLRIISAALILAGIIGLKLAADA